MKLTQQEVSAFSNIVSTAASAGIEQIVFQNKEHQVASGIRDGSCAIIARKNVPGLSQKMGLVRLPSLKKQLDLLQGANLEITAKESERGEIVQLEMVAGKTKTQYRCSAAAHIKAPSDISDGEVLGILTVNKEELTMIMNGARAVNGEKICFVARSGGPTYFEASDGTNKFTVELEKKIELVDEDNDSAVFYYETGIFSSLLRAAIGSRDSLDITVGVSGTIQFELNECEMSIFAQIEGDN